MSNVKVEIMCGEERIVVELFVDKAPIICNAILNNLPVEGTIQHAKLNGQLFFAGFPFTTPFENTCRGGDLVTGDVAYYNPRNQLCILYGKGSNEPLPISHIGRIVEGLDKAELVGMRNWMKQGGILRVTKVVE